MKMNRVNPAIYALLAALTLTACQQEKQSPAEANPDGKPGLSVSDGMLVLPVVSGNPGAAYFTLTNSGKTATTVAAIDIAGADKAEMHETSGGSMATLTGVEVKPGETVKFERGGKHVMAFGIKPEVKSGADVEITLTFADGDKLSAPLEVMTMNDHMDHDNMH